MKENAINDVVLIHGLWFRASFLKVLSQRLAAGGFRVHSFNYHTTRVPLERSARRLFHFCRRNVNADTHFVGHSLGGLLVLKMLDNHAWPRPGRVLFLGTPLKGSAVSRRASSWRGTEFLFGHAQAPLGQGQSTWPADRQTGMIAGTRPIGLGTLTGRLERPNDGTVAVVETIHRDMTDRIELPVTHTGMIYSPEVANSAIKFLRKGHF